MTTTQDSPTAAGSGANATEASGPPRPTPATGADPASGSPRSCRVLSGVHDAIRDETVTYPEFQAAKQWLIEVGEGGEWPLFLDVFVEHAVEEVAAGTQDGTKGSILGPYYLPGQARLASPATLPQRPDEKGIPLVFSGPGPRHGGAPLAHAELDIWHADEQGYYSGFAPHLPDGNLRGVVVTDDAGPVRDPHDPARALPDPHRRADRHDDRGRRLAPVAPRPPAPARPRTRAPARSPRSCTSPAASGSTATSPRRPSPSWCIDPATGATAPAARRTYDFVLEPA